MVSQARSLIRILTVLAACCAAAAQPGETVTVQGQVAGPAALSGDHAYLSLVGETGATLLEAPEFMFERVSAGDRLEVRGVLADRQGQKVLRPVQIRTVGNAPLPRAAARRIGQLQNSAALGSVAMVEGRVTAMGENAAGHYLILEDGQAEPFAVYLSRRRETESAGLDRFHVGDRVRAAGIVIVSGSEYRMIIPEGAAVALVSRHWPVAPRTLLGVPVAILLAGLWRWWRYRQTQMRHRAIRGLNAISEDLVSTATAEEISRKLAAALPAVLGISTVRLFRFDRTQQRLELVEETPVAEREESAAATAFRNRAPLLIADARRTRILPRSNDTAAGGMIVMPIQARDELVGVLSLSHGKPIRIPSPEELAALQHVGNQAALALKTIESSQRKEQLLRSEKLAAAGQLIQGMTGELRAPLESIVMAAKRLADLGTRDARAIVNESLRASAVLSRLSMVARGDDEQAQPVDVNQTVTQAVDACRAEWEEMDVELALSLNPQPLWVLGSALQIGQVIRNLLSTAVRAAVETRSPDVKVTCGAMARRVTVAIEYNCSGFGERRDEDTGSLGFEVCRGILQGNGGELKFSSAGGEQCRIEMSMPAAFPATPRAERKRLNRAMTALLLEPDVAVQRRLVSVWTAQGHRAMPVANEAEGIELANRLRIDAIFCAVRVGNASWVEIFERTRERVPSFILLTEGVDSDESALFPEGEGLVLRKPVDAGDVAKLLERVEDRAGTGVTPAPVRT